MYQAIDGRVWFYPNVRNFWTNAGSQNASDWFSLDFGAARTVRSARLYFFGDGARFKAPPRTTMQYWTGRDWAAVPSARNSPARPVENGETTITFSPVQTSRLRALFTNPAGAAVALVEMKAYGTETVTAQPLTDTPPLGRPRAGRFPLNPAGLQEENSHTGELNGVRWRDAENGGFFAFDLPPVPGAANALVVTYWGSDVGNRRFDILVNGVRIAEQTLENNRPGQFFEVAYPLPLEMDRDRPQVTVRFQAKPGAFAGGACLVRR